MHVMHSSIALGRSRCYCPAGAFPSSCLKSRFRSTLRCVGQRESVPSGDLVPRSVIADEAQDFCELICDPDGFSSGIVRGSKLKYNDPASLPLRRRGFLQWEAGKPSHVLIIKKIDNEAAAMRLKQIGDWLQTKGLTVHVEPAVHAKEYPEFKRLDDDNYQLIDFCITLGGDGTVLHLASLFDSDNPMPPVMSFSMGTLGFLTPFDVSDYEALLTRVLAANVQPVYCTLHARMRCEVHVNKKVKVIHNVLNEVVIDRGAFPGAVVLELFIDQNYVTTVEADGLIIATPSGSTAYSMSVGGSLIAPSVPCTIISPIAPLSLSFRPVVIPESSIICVQVPSYARSSARISFDGKKRESAKLLAKGSLVVLQATRNPLPMINLSHLDTDWYAGISQKLKWNLTLRPPPRPLGNDPSMSSIWNGDSMDGAILPPT